MMGVDTLKRATAHRLRNSKIAAALIFTSATAIAWADSPQRDCGPPEPSMAWLSQLPEAVPAVQRARARVFAEAGSVWSQCRFGSMLAEGFGGPADLSESVQWFKRAALRGHTYAQFHLGVLLSADEGVARDDAQALVWLELAQHGPADENTLAAAQAVHNFVLMRVQAQEAAQAQAAALAQEAARAQEAAQAQPTAASPALAQEEASTASNPQPTTQASVATAAGSAQSPTELSASPPIARPGVGPPVPAVVRPNFRLNFRPTVGPPVRPYLRPIVRPYFRPMMRPTFRPPVRPPLRVMPRPNAQAPAPLTTPAAAPPPATN